MFKQIDEKKSLLDKKRPFPPNTVKSLREHLLLEWTYNSNAIEGNTLTLSETKVVLEGITVGGKTLREHLEVINHKDAILYVEEIVKNNEPFSEWQIKNIHQLVLKTINDQNAGRYRTENVLISGASHIPPEHILVPQEMEDLIKWYTGEAVSLHPVERSARLHVLFVKIHPFIDGNGRTARLLLNLELMKTGYPPIVIKKEKRAEYYNSLDKTHTTNQYDDFLHLVIEALDQTLDLYLKII
jgi:Fic family protein